MENYSVHPLLPVVILVCDRHDSTTTLGTDGFVSLREVARTQTVLVILTGVTNRTSTGVQISLDPLKSFALPIDRDDATGLDILRVPLNIAVRFVIELEARIDEQKEASSANLDKSLCMHQTPAGYSGDIRFYPNIWARIMRAEALKNGFRELADTKYAGVRVHAHLSGQDSGCELEHMPFGQTWKP